MVIKEGKGSGNLDILSFLQRRGQMVAIFIPGIISKLETITPNEIRLIEITLPSVFLVDAKELIVTDEMLPGNAFVAIPKKIKRAYTRSNCSKINPMILQTIVNDTHNNANTSRWWQKPNLNLGTEIPIRMETIEQGNILKPFELQMRDRAKSLQLESDAWWGDKKFVCIAFSTGITPFLAYVRHMATQGFQDTHVVLIVSVKNREFLICHDELMGLHKKFPRHFNYEPWITRPAGKQDSRLRLIWEEDSHINMTNLLMLVPDLTDRHVRICGGKQPNQQLQQGIKEYGISIQSYRAEAWG